MLSSRHRPAAAVAIGVALFAEGLAAPISLAAFDPRLRPADRPAYRWLARNAPGAVLELPVHDWAIAPTLTYQYATLVHRHPIVNGYSGRGSALQSFLGGGLSPLGELDRMDGAIDLLQAVGIRYVVVHPPDYEDRAVGAQTIAAIRRSAPRVAEEYVFPGGVAFRLTDPSPSTADAAAGARIDPGTLHVTSSDAGDRIPQMFDGDAGTRWFIDRPQDGRMWIRIDLDRPRDVSRIGPRNGVAQRRRLPARSDDRAHQRITVSAVVSGRYSRRIGTEHRRNRCAPRDSSRSFHRTRRKR